MDKKLNSAPPACHARGCTTAKRA